MIEKGLIANILVKSFDLYKRGFKIFLILGVFLATLSEYFKLKIINAGFDKVIIDYFHDKSLPENPDNYFSLLILGIISFLLVLTFNAFLLCLGINLFTKKQSNTYECFQDAFRLFRRKLILFIIISIINGALFLIASILGLFGIWFITSFTLTVFPILFLSKHGVVSIFINNFILLGKNWICALQMGFLVVALMLVKNLIYVFLNSLTNTNVGFGIEHALIVFTEAFTLPLTLIISICTFFVLNEKEKIIND